MRDRRGPLAALLLVAGYVVGGIALAGWDRLGWSGGLGERWIMSSDCGSARSGSRP